MSTHICLADALAGIVNKPNRIRGIRLDEIISRCRITERGERQITERGLRQRTGCAENEDKEEISEMKRQKEDLNGECRSNNLFVSEMLPSHAALRCHK
jgi:hypothetical protein